MEKQLVQLEGLPKHVLQGRLQAAVNVMLELVSMMYPSLLKVLTAVVDEILAVGAVSPLMVKPIGEARKTPVRVTTLELMVQVPVMPLMEEHVDPVTPRVLERVTTTWLTVVEVGVNEIDKAVD